MKTQLAKTALAAALAFTFSCSSDDEPGNNSSSSGGGKGNDIANYKTVPIGSQTWMAENLNIAVEGSKSYNGAMGVPTN